MNTIRYLLSPVLCVLALQFPVTAHARGAAAKAASEKFHQTCDQTLSKNNAGDISLGDCKKAELADKVNKNQAAASVVYGVMAGTAAVLTVISYLHTPWSEAAAQAARVACIAMGAGAMVKNMVDSSLLNKAGDDIVGSYASTVNGVVKGGAALGGMQVVTHSKAALAFIKEGSSATTGGASNTTNNNTGKACLATTIAVGVMLSSSISAASNAKNALIVSTNSANNQMQASQKTASFALTAPSGPKAPDNNVKAPNNNAAVEYACDSKSGNDYLKCSLQGDPDALAMIAQPGVLDSMNKALGGKNLGDFAKGYNGETQQDLANYVGAGLGMGGSAMGAIMDANSKTAKVLGITDAYKPSAFASASGGSGSTGGNSDDMSKMMSDLMKQMNPSDDGLGAQRDPAGEISFRQMDLLSPEQVAERKDISLFSRIQYRMQKNSTNLEQMHWRTDQPQAPGQ
ncbi:MAG: hypothetical protein JST80_03035 [Bdellovibrionales bacterium]|nr:hypothetical protein [Bdellovibrionales bacterium]